MASTLMPCSNKSSSAARQGKLDLFRSGAPLGYAGNDANLTRYVGNSPTQSTDPDGLQTNPFGLATNVLNRDLSVWKANTRKTQYGEFKVNVRVLREEGQRRGYMKSGVDITIEFVLNKKCSSCKEITFVQTVRPYYTKGGGFYNLHMLGIPGTYQEQDPFYKDIVAKRTTGKEGTAVSAGVMLDVSPKYFPSGKPTIFFTEALAPEYRRQTGYVSIGPGGTRSVRSAIMQDEPGVGIDIKNSVTYELETAAICKETGTWLGSLRWGFVTVGGGKVGATLLPMSVSDRPSASHLAAISNMMQVWWPSNFVIQAELNPAPFTALFPPKYGVRLPLPPPGSVQPPVQYRSTPPIRIVK